MSSPVAQLLIVNGYVPEISTSPAADASWSPDRPTAVAVQDGRIAAVGQDELLRFRGPQTEVIDAGGGAILPGLNDGHLHFCASAVTRYVLLDVGHAQTWSEIHALLQRAQPSADGWIRAHGNDDAVQGVADPATFLEVNPGRPTVLFDRTGHQLLVNRAGLAALQLEDFASQVPGGVVGRTGQGLPNGHFADAAMEVVTSRLPALPAGTLLDAFRRHQRDLHQLGLTSLTDPGLGPGGNSLLAGACGEPSLQGLIELAAHDELRLRINALLLFSGTGGATAEDTERGLASDLADRVRAVDEQWLRVAGVKVFADGTPRSGTAWMKDPYCLPCGHGHGGLVIAGHTEQQRLAELGKIISAIHSAGYQAGVHATGDAATHAVIDAFANSDAPAKDLRHYVIHGAFNSDELFGQLAEAGIGLSTNPAIRAGAGALMHNILGRERYRQHQPLASLLRAGVRTNIASDAPVTSPDWRNSVIAAVTRNSTARIDEDRSECLSLSQALATMTCEPAWQDRAEDRKGRVESGYLADLCILADRLPERAEDLRTLPTATTIVGGDIVYSAATN